MRERGEDPIVPNVTVRSSNNNQLSAVGDAVGTTCKIVTNIRVSIIYTAHVRSEQSLSSYEVSKKCLTWKKNQYYYMVKNFDNRIGPRLDEACHSRLTKRICEGACSSAKHVATSPIGGVWGSFQPAL